jgi:GNAT superfamily N-acetyltransferase
MMIWRPMEPVDLRDVHTIADRIHPDHPEDLAVLAERQRLFPDGCQVLEHDGAIVGYVISHPWLFGKPPALNSMLETLPLQPTSFYLHDLAIGSDARGRGCGAHTIERLAGIAAKLDLPSLSLVAVNGSQMFWRKHGFVPRAMPGMATKLMSYGGDARFMARDLGSPVRQ